MVYFCLPRLLRGVATKNNIGLAALEVAKQELKAGAREIGGNNRGRFVAKYLQPCGLKPPQPWCAAFISWCIREGSKKRPAMPYMCSARQLFNWAGSHGLRLEKPEPGCLIFWKRGLLGWQAHVGFVERVEPGKIATIEGNRTSKVQRFQYQGPRISRILGYIRIPDGNI